MARPKLKDGERGNYNVSRKEQEKRKVQKRITANKKRLRDKLNKLE